MNADEKRVLDDVKGHFKQKLEESTENFLGWSVRGPERYQRGYEYTICYRQREDLTGINLTLTVDNAARDPTRQDVQVRITSTLLPKQELHQEYGAAAARVHELLAGGARGGKDPRDLEDEIDDIVG